MFLTASSAGYKGSRAPIIRLDIIKISTWFWIGCTVATLATSQQNFYTNGRYGKREDPAERAPSSFWTGSRYGRSGDSALSDMSNGVKDKSGRIGYDDSGKEVEVSPRVDRFFLGSRYGKRTISNDRRMDSLKHFETSLDFLISFDHMQTDDKEQLKILSKKLDGKNLVDLRSDDHYSAPAMINKNDRSSSPGNGFACLFTGVTNLYRCFHRRMNATQGFEASEN